MREIPLSQGYIAKIDDADWPLVSGHSWHAYVHPRGGNVYAKATVRKGRGKSVVWMHRVILGARPGQIVDHANGDGCDNRRSNLRLCSHRENMRNRRAARTNKLGLKGVYQDGSRFRAIIMVDKRQMPAGNFNCPLKAARAYDVAAMRHFGEFARLNFSPDRDWIFPHETAGSWPPEPPA